MFHVERQMMNRLILGVCIFMCCQSCISLHKAEQIDGYKLLEKENTDRKSTRFRFQVKHSKNKVDSETRKYFRLPTDAFVDSFQSSIFEVEEAEVSISKSWDQNQYLDFSDFILSSKASTPNEKMMYLSISVRSKSGKDLLGKNSLHRQAVLNTLKTFRDRFK